MSHFVDLLQRQEGQHPDALEHIGVIHIAPVLIEIIGGSLVGIKPDGIPGGLAHLLSLAVGQQGDGHGIGILAELAADQLGAAQHIRPLVVPAELHVASVMLEHIVEIIGLHNHIVELKEGQSLLHALFVALGAQHIIDREAGADLTEQLHIVEIQQPVRIVEHQRLALAEFNEALHLPLEAFCVMVDILSREHSAHISSAGRVPDHGRAAADEGNRLIACQLQPLHKCQCHEMSGGQAVCRAVKAYIESCLTGIDHGFDFFLVGHLGDKSPCYQLIVNCHRNKHPFQQDFYSYIIHAMRAVVKGFSYLRQGNSEHFCQGSTWHAGLFSKNLLTTQSGYGRIHI